MKPIGELLAEGEGIWRRASPAKPEEIEKLKETCGEYALPELVELLQFSNGGEGDLAVMPEWFVLYEVEEIVDCFGDRSLREEFPGHFFFGTNGGLERIALDTRVSGETWPVVAIDPIAGVESAMRVAASICEFVELLGKEAPHAEEAGENGA